MKTYAEEQGREAFDWNEFLNKKEYIRGELSEAASSANRWVTCACGNLCSIIPRYTEEEASNERTSGDNRFAIAGEPKDKVLKTLGIKFGKRIRDMLISFDEDGIYGANEYKQEAIQILSEIEARSAQLIKEYETSTGD